MALEYGSELTCSMGVKDMTASIAWYERVMRCELLYRADEIGWPRAICDYLSGMTDRYAIDEHKRIFGGNSR